MALTASKMLPLGSSAPHFSLPNAIDGRTVSQSDFFDRPLLVMFICNHCPYVKHILPELVRLGKNYKETSLSIVAIQSNDVENYPEDAPEKMKLEFEQRGLFFPYLYDESQTVAIQFSAACTPDFFLFDQNHRLVYRGRLDETRPNRVSSGNYNSEEVAPHGRELRMAIDAVLNGQKPSEVQHPSMGCNIKWKPDCGPSTFRIS